MDPGTTRDVRARWQRWTIGLFVAVLVGSGALLWISRGRIGLGLKVVGLVLVLAVTGALARGLVKARGHGPTLRETAVALLGVACVLVFLWFVVVYG